MNKGTILVVDDEKAQVEALSGFLRKLHYIVLGETSPEKGLALVKGNPVDLVLTDHRMPEMTGVEFLQRVKEINPEISVIVMTAFGSVETAVEALKSGAADYLQKPLDLDQVEFIVNRCFQQKRLISENRRLREELKERFHFDGIVSALSLIHI